MRKISSASTQFEVNGPWSRFIREDDLNDSSICEGERMRRIHSPPTYVLTPSSKDWTNKGWLVKAAKGDPKHQEILLML
jgi:hypothetical protein